MRQAAAVKPESPVASIHDLRKRSKRLRYVLELFGDVLPNAKTKALVRETKRLQDDLGKFQDNEVHRRLVESMVSAWSETEPSDGQSPAGLCPNTRSWYATARRNCSRASSGRRYARRGSGVPGLATRAISESQMRGNIG